MKNIAEELASLINTHSLESGSDTPDFILSEFLLDVLRAYDKAVTARSKWYEEGEDPGSLVALLQEKEEEEITTTLTLMCGLPRSGKDTWLQQRALEGAVIVCPDDIRKEIFGQQFFTPMEDFVWALSFAMTRLLLQQSVSVYVNATNISTAERHRWIRLARSYNVPIHLHWIDASVDECLIRNAKSPSDKKVPPNVISNMHATFEAPGIIEGFSHIHRWYVDSTTVEEIAPFQCSGEWFSAKKKGG